MWVVVCVGGIGGVQKYPQQLMCECVLLFLNVLSFFVVSKPFQRVPTDRRWNSSKITEDGKTLEISQTL